jgi:uncharacterized membrane protein
MAAEDADAGSGLERIILFSDAVIAIAITLLVLDIRLPALPEHADNPAVVAALIEVAPKVEAYVISFLVVGQFWASHHLRFRFIRRYDSTLIWLNLLFLMAIGFVPFASSVLSEHPVAAAYTLYDGTMALVAVLSAAIWGYAVAGDRLVDPGLPSATRRQSLIAPLGLAAVFLVSGLLVQFNVHAGHWAWLLLIPVVLPRPARRRRHRGERP